MSLNRLVIALAMAAAACTSTLEARAVSPGNPYRTFNLSGVNYGSMQWEKAQRQGKRAWPSNNTPARRTYRRR